MHKHIYAEVNTKIITSVDFNNKLFMLIKVSLSSVSCLVFYLRFHVKIKALRKFAGS